MRYTWYHCQCEYESNAFTVAFCQSGILRYSNGYAIILGVIGTMMCVHDMKKIITSGCHLPCHLFRVRKFFWKSMNHHHYRDIKLASVTFTFEYYLMLVIGAIMSSEVFLVPWLIFDGFYLVFELFATLLSIIYKDPTMSKPKRFLINMFMIYNWLAVFCASSNMSGSCR